jgi:D-psicose/D-tagatose/L-ribulose 3-epimerase
VPRVAMMDWMRDEPLETTIERLARHRYDALEISGEPEAYDATKVGALLEEHGIECWGAATIMKNGRDLLAGDSEVRDRTLEYLKDTITFASRLRGSIVTITPAVGRVEPVGGRERSWAVESLRAALEHAHEVGVRLGFEALNRYETSFVNRCEQALALAEEVGEGFGVVLDLFHMNIEEADWPAAIRTAGSRLVDLHVADSNREPPGRGSIDWPLLARELESIGYDGCLTVEFFPGHPLDDGEYDRWTQESIAFLRRTFAPDPALTEASR